MNENQKFFFENIGVNLFKVEQKRNIRKVFTDVKYETRRFTMNAQKRFECYISEIEKMAEKSECLKASEIAEELISSHGIGIRDINAVFTFLTESSLIYYIRERQMMAAYKAIISSEKFNAEIGISITGYSDQSAFGKAFKQRFGMTPKEAFEKKDLSKYIEKLTWDALAKDAVLFEHTEIKVKPVKMRFGISEEQYRIANYAADLQVLFDLDDYQSEKAFELAGIINIDMKLAFEFISEYCLCFIMDNELSLSESSFLMDVAKVYFNVVQNVYQAWDLVDVIKKYHYKVSDFSPAFLQMYHENCGVAFGTLVYWAKRHGSDICQADFIEDEIRKNITEIVLENYTPEQAEDIFCPDFDYSMDKYYDEELQRDMAEYYPITDEERADWEDRSDEFSMRMSVALDMNTDDEDDKDTSDGQYFDF